MAAILIAEDEAAIHELIRRNLQSVGHSCYSAFDGTAAVEALAERNIDFPWK